MALPGQLNPFVLSELVETPAYEIDQGLRFVGTNYIQGYRPLTNSNLTTWTYSVWFKPAEIASESWIFGRGRGPDAEPSKWNGIALSSTLQLYWVHYDGTNSYYGTTTALYRDYSAWSHLTWVWDTDNATAADRVRAYINGTRVSFDSASADPPSGTSSLIGAQNQGFALGTRCTQGSSTRDRYFDGYMAEAHWIDGQALDPTEFGEYDDYGVWRAKEYRGTYGTNGWYYDFADITTVGTDLSGNGNDQDGQSFTTSGSGIDLFIDSPTKNNGLFNFNQRYYGNLYSYGDAADWRSFGCGSNGGGNSGYDSYTGLSDGKFCTMWSGYTEYGGACHNGFGLLYPGTPTGNVTGVPTKFWTITTDGNFSNSGLDSTPTFTNPVCGGRSGNPGYQYVWIAWDMDAGNLWVRSNTTGSFPGWTGDPVAGTGAQVTGLYPNANEQWSFFSYQYAQGGTYSCNLYSQNAWSDDSVVGAWVPEGFKMWSTLALGPMPIQQPSKHWGMIEYTGTESAQSVSGLDFQPDLIWIKSKSSVNDHRIYDSIRGATKDIYPNLTNAETTDAQSVTSFDSGGFSMGTASGMNSSSAVYEAWCWKGGGSAVSNSDGDIDSQVSANTTAGFSVVTWTANGSNTDTVGHGLDRAPEFIIYKNRDATSSMTVWTTVTGENRVNSLNNSSAATNLGSTYGSPSDTTISNYGYTDTNDIVAYCWHSVTGYSKIGIYYPTNNSNGVHFNCGFRPAWIMIRRHDTSGGNDWQIFDYTRSTYNPAAEILTANSTAAQSDGGSTTVIDLLANGFKLRGSGGSINSAGTYLFMAFAEHPWGGSNVSQSPGK